MNEHLIHVSTLAQRNKHRIWYRTLNILIAMIWLINGLYCKVLQLVPRHEVIVGNIVSVRHAHVLSLCIGLAEVLMAIWIMTGYRSKLNAWLQMAIIASMNILEFVLVPELLLWGRFNMIFALLLIGLIYYNQFVIKPLTKTIRQV